MKTGILFDLDGTLLNTLTDLTDAVNYSLEQYGCPPRPISYVRMAIGNGSRRLIIRSLPGTPEDPPVDDVLETYHQRYAAHSLDKTAPFPGIEQALRLIARQYPVAIVSNKPDPAVKKICAHFFPGIYARGESTDCPRKPAPDMLKKTLAHLGLNNCVYVGDSDVDVITAQNTGVPCLSVLWGYRDRECMEAAGGRYYCDDPAKMPEILNKIVEENYGK